jgi:hypothetical protein
MKTLFERSFTADELMDIDDIKDRYSHLVDPKIIDWFIAVDQFTDDGYTRYLKWMLEIYLHRKDRNVTKETIINMVHTAVGLDETPQLLRCETYEEAEEMLRRFDTVEGVASGWRSADTAPEVLYEDHEWAIFRPSSYGEMEKYGIRSWSVVSSSSTFRERGGDDGAFIMIANKLSFDTSLNFLIRSMLGGNITIMNGREILADNDPADNALSDFIAELGFHFNPKAREAILNLEIIKRKYDIDKLRREHDQYERESFNNDSWWERINNNGWDKIKKYFKFDKFIEDYAGEIKIADADDLKSLFIRYKPLKAEDHDEGDSFELSGEGSAPDDGRMDLIDAILSAVPAEKIQEELGTESSAETYNYLRDNFNSIDFDALVDNLSYGYRPNLRDEIVNRRPEGDTGIPTTFEELLLSLGVDMSNTDYDYCKRVCKRLETDYDFFNDYVDSSKMEDDYVGHPSDGEIIRWYEDMGYGGENDSENFTRHQR